MVKLKCFGGHVVAFDLSIPTRAWIGPNCSVRARPASDRVLTEPGPSPTALQIFFSEPEPSPTEAISQLFILMPHLRTFFMNSLALLNSGINR